MPAGADCGSACLAARPSRLGASSARWPRARCSDVSACGLPTARRVDTSWRGSPPPTTPASLPPQCAAPPLQPAQPRHPPLNSPRRSHAEHSSTTRNQASITASRAACASRSSSSTTLRQSRRWTRRCCPTTTAATGRTLAGMRLPARDGPHARNADLGPAHRSNRPSLCSTACGQPRPMLRTFRIFSPVHAGT